MIGEFNARAQMDSLDKCCSPRHVMTDIWFKVVDYPRQRDDKKTLSSKLFLVDLFQSMGYTKFSQQPSGTIRLDASVSRFIRNVLLSAVFLICDFEVSFPNTRCCLVGAKYEQITASLIVAKPKLEFTQTKITTNQWLKVGYCFA